MFLRTKTTPSGRVLQLVESFRNAEGRSRQRLVVSLGSLDIPREWRRQVSVMVEDRLYGRTPTNDLGLTYPARMAEWVDGIVRRVEREGRWRPLAPRRSRCVTNDCGLGEAIDGVLVDEVSHRHDTALGSILLPLHAWEILGMPELLQTLGFNEAQRKVASCLVINRLCEPLAEHAVPEWVHATSLPDLLGEDLLTGGKDRYYRTGDRLLAKQLDIEAHLRRRQSALFGLDRTILLYDLTNTHFEGVCSTNPKAVRGCNKQKRNDCPQIVIGMVFDRDGFELAHRTFAGNMSDSRSLVQMVKSLHRASAEQDLLGASVRPLVVMDSGLGSAANRLLLRSEGFSYVVNHSRPGRKKWHEHFASEQFMEIEGRDGKAPVLVRQLDVTTKQKTDSGGREEVAERLVLCKSAGRRLKEEAILSKAEGRYLQQLTALQSRIEQGRLKDPAKIQRALGAVQKKNSRVARYYEVGVEQGEPAELSWRRHDEQYADDDDLLGCYVLRTDRHDMGPSQLWQLYTTLCRAEDGFRALKGNLGLRPNRHRVEERVDAHVFITVLAYHLHRFIEHSLEREGDTRSWRTIRRILQTHCYSTMHLPTREGCTHRIRRPGVPDERQRQIYDLLGVDLSGLPESRTVIEAKRLCSAYRDPSVDCQ